MSGTSFLFRPEAQHEPGAQLVGEEGPGVPEDLVCAQCGEPMFVTGDGVSHHEGDTPEGVDYDADGDHVAVADEADAVLLAAL